VNHLEKVRIAMDTMTREIQVDGSGNVYAKTTEGLEYVGWWNESLRQLSLEDGDVYQVSHAATVESFAAGLLLEDEDGDERASLMDRDELIDRGYFDPELPEGVVEPDLFEDDGPEPIRDGDRW
jgi:hypothetical protein